METYCNGPEESLDYDAVRIKGKRVVCGFDISSLRRVGNGTAIVSIPKAAVRTKLKKGVERELAS